MAVVSRTRAIPETAGETAAPAAFAHADQPIAFSGMAGIFTPAPEREDALAVLFVSPWGLEDLCVRKFWRVISERLAERGVASLRFDLPGTGDSLDPDSTEAGVALWEEAIFTAARELARRSGTARIALVGQGLGASLAVRISARLEGLAGLALLAPVVSGRSHLREIAAMSRIVDDSLGLSEDQRQTKGVSIAGFRLPDAIAADLKRMDLMGLAQPPAVPCLVAERAARPSDGEFSTYLAACGVCVERLAFDGYEALVANPAVSKVPVALAERLAVWLASLSPAGGVSAPCRPPLASGVLKAADFTETPVSFAKASPFYGVLTRPTGPRRGATVLFLSTGYDRHCGWGRSTVAMARALAMRGIASLRFDAANVADSPPAPDAPEQVLYSVTQECDAAAALDFLTAQEMGPIVLAGRCSGAYLSFRVAVADPRVAGAVAVNPYTFRWQADRDVDSALQFGPRALSEYGQRALQWATFRRLAKGEIDVRRALANFFTVLSRKCIQPLMLFIRHYTEEGRLVHSAFRTLLRRGTKLTLIYSENDVGWEHFANYFGQRGNRLCEYGNVQLVVIADADHNLTPPHARAIYLDEVTSLALRFSRQA